MIRARTFTKDACLTMGNSCYLYLVLLIGIFDHRVEGLTCLRCERFSHPRFCKVATQCADGEVCYTEIVGNTDGTKSFNMGCTPTKKLCNSTIDETSGQFCHQCCASDLCNAELCGDHGYPKERGPICYNCHSNLLNEPCHILGMCHLDEVCSISYERIFSELTYTSGCSKPHECAAHNHVNPASIIGKRSIDDDITFAEDDFDLGNCYQCCDGDLCNVNCTIKHINHCDKSPCLNGGICLNNQNNYTCVCNRNYTGLHCETDTRSCVSLPCLNGGNCTESQLGYNCTCNLGYTGQNCEIAIDHCQSRPCMNGASCFNKPYGYQCYCFNGFTGPNCGIDNRPCSSSPCQNNGTCINMMNQTYNCNCTSGYIGSNCQIGVLLIRIGLALHAYSVFFHLHGYHSCRELQRSAGVNTSGVYPITSRHSNETYNVLCDMDTDGGGWTVFQYRFNGTVDFYQNFSMYENGFGDLHGEFWLGLKHIYDLTRQCSTVALRINLENSKGAIGHRTFTDFNLSRPPGYALQITRVSAPSDRGLMYSNGHTFSTFDYGVSKSCATRDYAGWWFSSCAYANLNGKYITPGDVEPNRSESGMTYRNFDDGRSLKSSKMMLRVDEGSCRH